MWTNAIVVSWILKFYQFQDSACDRGNKIFRELDVNGDGELSEDEFVKGQIIWEGQQIWKSIPLYFDFTLVESFYSDNYVNIHS